MPPQIRATAGFVVVLVAVLAGLAAGVLRGMDGDDEPARQPAVDSPAPSVEVTAPPPATPGRCRGGHVALTFDDGPSITTGPILEQLAARRWRATFFNVGAREEQMPDLVRRTVAGGHAFGNHTYDHPFLDTLEPEAMYQNLLGTNQIHRQLTGGRLRWFRPPYGRTTDAIVGAARELGMEQVLWTNDTRDWDPHRSVREVVRQVLEARDGDVVLLHDDGHRTTMRALPEILAGFAERGVCPGRLQPSRRPVVAWKGLTHRVVAGPWVESRARR